MNQLLKRRRNVWIHASGRQWVAVKYGVSDETRSDSVKGKSSGRHLVENDPEGEEIRAAVELLGPYLLRRHVGHGPQRCSWNSEMFISDIRKRLCRLRRHL